ncbi:hypothetical protein YTPLAS18_25830 [Nitrospira sp.]|nr:hypothetical protein YTPLAS18_25830 [Nitrospira sp.]
MSPALPQIPAGGFHVCRRYWGCYLFPPAAVAAGADVRIPARFKIERTVTVGWAPRLIQC